MQQQEILLWTPHKNQEQIIEDPARFKVIVCGRRFGKSTLAIYKILEDALMTKNGLFFYIAPTYRQAKMIAWQMLQEALHTLPKELVKKTNESELSAIVGNNSQIFLKGADDPNALRGVGLNGVILDEFADMKAIAFDEVIRPALTDKKGWCWFIGTPRGFNHFYDVFNKAATQND